MFWFPGQQQPAESYQAFVKLLRKWTDPLIGLLKEVFRRRMQELLAGVWTVAGWTVFACDGSRVDVPRTRKNEERYSSKSKLSRKAQKRRRQAKRRRTQRLARARKASVPHIWLTVMRHVGSGLPWDWRAGPAGVWAMGLHSHCRLVRRGVPPEKISFAGVLRAYRRCMREYKSQPDPGERLEEMLDRAIIDSYQRKNKTSRDYLRKKEEQAAGPPRILKATRTQIRMAKEVKIEYQKGLTA